MFCFSNSGNKSTAECDQFGKAITYENENEKLQERLQAISNVNLSFNEILQTFDWYMLNMFSQYSWLAFSFVLFYHFHYLFNICMYI